jgi:pilus assembly protein CpaB
MKRRTAVIIAIVLGIVGTLVLAAYVRGAADRAAAGEKRVTTIVASAAISTGTAAEDLRRVTTSESVPQKVRPDGAVTSLRGLRGLVTTTDLVDGEILLKSRFAAPGAVTQGVGRVKVPKGSSEITLSLAPERAVGGLIQPGDRVVVMGTPSRQTGDSSGTVVVAHQVLVTNVQIEDSSNQPTGDQTQTAAPTKNLLVTIAVDDATATAILAYAASDDVWLGAEQTTTGTTTP